MIKLPCGIMGISCADSCPDPEKRKTDLTEPLNAIHACYTWHKGLKRKEDNLTIKRLLGR